MFFFSFVVAAERNGIPIGPKVCMVLISRWLQNFDSIFNFLLCKFLNGLISSQLKDNENNNNNNNNNNSCLLASFSKPPEILLILN